MIEWWVFAFGNMLAMMVYSLIEKKLLLKEHATEFAAISSLITVIFSLFFLPFVKFDFEGRYWALIFVSSIISAYAFLLFAKAVRHMEISTASALRGAVPVFTLLFSIILIGEGIDLVQGGGVFLVVAGVYILESKRHHLFNPFRDATHLRTPFYILGALFFFGLSTAITRIILKDGAVGIYTLLLLKSIFAALFLVGVFLSIDRKRSAFGVWKSSRGWLFLLTFVGVASSLLYYKAMTMAAAPLVSTIERLSVLGVIFLGREYFHEKHIFKKIIASIIMIAGAILIIS
jgi:drug/metabolite transporter (DMT)-like permease